MARVLHGIEKGLRLFAENGNELIDILSGTAAPDGLGDQGSAKRSLMQETLQTINSIVPQPRPSGLGVLRVLLL
jgi:hypothetical protein